MGRRDLGDPIHGCAYDSNGSLEAAAGLARHTVTQTSVSPRSAEQLPDALVSFDEVHRTERGGRRSSRLLSTAGAGEARASCVRLGRRIGTRGVVLRRRVWVRACDRTSPQGGKPTMAKTVPKTASTGSETADGPTGQAQQKTQEVASQAQDKAREAAGQARGR